MSNKQDAVLFESHHGVYGLPTGVSAGDIREFFAAQERMSIEVATAAKYSELHYWHRQDGTKIWLFKSPVVKTGAVQGNPQEMPKV